MCVWKYSSVIIRNTACTHLCAVYMAPGSKMNEISCGHMKMLPFYLHVKHFGHLDVVLQVLYK